MRCRWATAGGAQQMGKQSRELGQGTQAEESYGDQQLKAAVLSESSAQVKPAPSHLYPVPTPPAIHKLQDFQNPRDCALVILCGSPSECRG